MNNKKYHKLFNFLVISMSLLALSACGEKDDDPVDYGESPINLTSGQAAAVVVGQANFTSSGTGNGTSGLNFPIGNVAFDAGKLYVPDYSNTRILVYNSVPTTDGASADYAIGQPDLMTYTSGLSDTALAGPEGPVIADGKLFLPEYDNNRVSIFNAIPATGPGTIDVVLGQPNKTSNATGCTASSFNRPDSVSVGGGKVVVADEQNRRVLIWNSIPTTDGQAADLVLGQPNLTTCTNNTGGLGPSSLSMVTGVWTDGERLIVLDTGNHRALIWNTFPTSDGQAADLVLGQADFTSNMSNRGGNPAANTLRAPFVGVYVRANQLFIADAENHRVLVWNTFPTSDGQEADVVLGQPGFTTRIGDTTDSGLNFPEGVHAWGNQVYVTDVSNNRIMIFEGS